MKKTRKTARRKDFPKSLRRGPARRSRRAGDVLARLLKLEKTYKGEAATTTGRDFMRETAKEMRQIRAIQLREAREKMVRRYGRLGARYLLTRSGSLKKPVAALEARLGSTAFFKMLEDVHPQALARVAFVQERARVAVKDRARTSHARLVATARAQGFTSKDDNRLLAAWTLKRQERASLMRFRKVTSGPSKGWHYLLSETGSGEVVKRISGAQRRRLEARFRYERYIVDFQNAGSLSRREAVEMYRLNMAAARVNYRRIRASAVFSRLDPKQKARWTWRVQRNYALISLRISLGLSGSPDVKI